MAVGPDPDIWGNLTGLEGCTDCTEECVAISDRHRDYGGYFAPLGETPGDCELPYPPAVAVLATPAPGSSPMVVECDDDAM